MSWIEISTEHHQGRTKQFYKKELKFIKKPTLRKKKSWRGYRALLKRFLERERRKRMKHMRT